MRQYLSNASIELQVHICNRLSSPPNIGKTNQPTGM